MPPKMQTVLSEKNEIVSNATKKTASEIEDSLSACKKKTIQNKEACVRASPLLS